MRTKKESVFVNRMKAVGYSFKGLILLIRTELSIQIQVACAILATILGFYFDISSAEWLTQLLVIGLVLATESLNTSVEKLADFIHPEYDKKIGEIKDIGAGASGIAAIIALIIAGIIYIPKISELF